MKLAKSLIICLIFVSLTATAKAQTTSEISDTISVADTSEVDVVYRLWSQEDEANKIHNDSIWPADSTVLYVIDGKEASRDDVLKLAKAEIELVNVVDIANDSIMQAKYCGSWATVYEISTRKEFYTAEIMPTFEGGDMLGFSRYVADRVSYPIVAQENGIQGRVVASFVVEKDGSMSDIRILQSPDSSLSKEVMRVLTEAPAWSAGQQQGENVRVRLTLPVMFRLQ